MAGIQPTVRLRTFTWVTDADEFPESIRDRSDAFLLARRSYESEGTLLAVAEIYLPRHIGALVTLTDLEQHPVYHVVQDRIGAHLRTAHLRVTMQELPERLTSMFDEGALQVIPRLERITEGSDGAFLEYTQTYIHPDAFEMVADVEASMPTDVSYTFETKPTPNHL